MIANWPNLATGGLPCGSPIARRPGPGGKRTHRLTQKIGKVPRHTTRHIRGPLTCRLPASKPLKSRRGKTAKGLELSVSTALLVSPELVGSQSFVPRIALSSVNGAYARWPDRLRSKRSFIKLDRYGCQANTESACGEASLRRSKITLI
jgi:hypothetical protein